MDAESRYVFSLSLLKNIVIVGISLKISINSIATTGAENVEYERSDEIA